MANQYRHWHHDELRGDDACRHEQGLGARVALRELLAKKREHRRVGEMKERDRCDENEQRLALQNNA